MQCREAPLPDSESSDPCAMELYVETLTGTAFELRVSPFETIMSVKAKIQRMEGIPISQQHLVWQSQELEDTCCLQDYRIKDGTTIKLVLAMRGGPINTRRVPVEDPAWREMVEYMEANREEIWERLPGGRQVTLLVFRDGDQINFFRVVDRGDGTLSPLAESISSAIRTFEDDGEDAVAHERIVENAVTLQKMRALRKKMDALTIKKKPKKTRNHNLPPSRPTSRATSHHVVAVKPKIHNGFSLNKHFRLPPVHPQSLPTQSRPEPVTNDTAAATTGTRVASSHKPEGRDKWLARDHRSTTCNALDDLVALENSLNVAETGAVPKVSNPVSSSAVSSSSSVASGRLSALEAYRCSLMQLRANISSSPSDSEAVDEQSKQAGVSTLSESKVPCTNVPRANFSASGRRRMVYAGRRLESLDSSDINQTLAKLDPRITVGGAPVRSTTNTSASAAAIGHRDRVLLRLPSQQRVAERLQHVDSVINFRPKTTPEKWDKGMSDVSVSEDITDATKEICDILSRTRSKLKSQGCTTVNPRERVRQRSLVIDPHLDLNFDRNENEVRHVTRDCSQDLELVTSIMAAASVGEESRDDLLKNLTSEDNLPQELVLKPSRFQRRLSASRQGRLNSAHKLPPVNAPTKLPTMVVPRCQVCNKKTGLATSYTCRCGRNFCASHRYAETHSCTFDYKTEGRRLLEQANPMVAAPKLPKI